MPKRLSHFNIGASIARMEEFKSNTGSMRGTKLSSGERPNPGRMPSEEVEKMAGHKIDYVVHSYATPIAYHHESGWHYPDTSYSATTSKHQSIVRGALGIKNAREKKLEERAARKKSKTELAEQALWNS